MKVETEGNYSDYAESVASQSGYRGRLESMKKLKKVRSIRLIRLPSKRSFTVGGRHLRDNLSIFSSVDTESLEGSTSVEMADASPNYMKATSSSHAKDSFQNTQRLLAKKTLTRMSTSLKLKRSLTRKLSGRTEPKRRLKSSRSIKLATVKGQKSTRKLSESSYGSDDQNWRSASDAGMKPQRVITRRLSLKPVRVLTKIATFKSKNSSMEIDHQISQSPNTSLFRATCSSALKDSHFPNHIDLPQEGSDSQASSSSSSVKVCPYSYCSLHGHRHANQPPLKRFMSMRRRALKSQKPTKMDHQPVTRPKQIGNARKASQKTQTVHSEEGRSNFQKKKKKPARDSCISPHGTPAFTVAEVTNTGNKGKNMEPDYEVQKMSSVNKDSTHASITDMASGMQERDKKYITMWQLVYKHAVLSDTGKCESKVPFDGKNMEGREKDSIEANEVNNSSCHDGCDTDQDMDDENKNAIELVQKAFDEILLPEPEELFSDDNLKSEGVDSDEVHSERNTSTSTELPKMKMMETKPDQRKPKSWSYLKKLILLRRFVTALEKVRNITPHRPRCFPSDANFEIEKVFLKRQTEEEKKNSEEWMLDYALQKVISKLEPAQRQRVTLLVEAFQTILPFKDAENGPRFPSTTKPQANPIQPLTDSSSHSKEASFFHDSTMELADKDGDDPMPELRNPIVLKERCIEIPGTETAKDMPEFETTEEDLSGKQSLAGSYDNAEKISSDIDNIYLGEIKDTRSSSLNEPVESCHEEAPANETVNDVPEDLLSNVNTANPHIKSESPERDVETKNLIGDNAEQFSSKSLILEGLVRSLRSNLINSGADANLVDEPKADRKERIEKVQPETETLEEFPAKEQSDAPTRAVVEPETPIEKQNNTGLWYMVYKHMVSNMAENNSKSLIDGEDDKESGFDDSRTRGTPFSYENTSVTDQDMHIKDHVVADPEVQQQQIEAIKMVEEAIDSIIPDDQDDFADQESVTDNTISDNSKQFDINKRLCSEGLNQKEEQMEDGIGIMQEQQQESAPKEGNKTNQQLSRNWSNLKKVILLRRFIKALEKVRKFNPRGPRYLPLELDSEAEKVNLKHQDVEERKGTEEWMLDYALRQVVSKLTPARKRKVGLLVEAFETVIPTIKN